MAPNQVTTVVRSFLKVFLSKPCSTLNPERIQRYSAPNPKSFTTVVRSFLKVYPRTSTPNAYTPNPTFQARHPNPQTYTPHPTSLHLYTPTNNRGALVPAGIRLHPNPQTLHPKPYIPSPTPHPPKPTPHTIHPYTYTPQETSVVRSFLKVFLLKPSTLMCI